MAPEAALVVTASVVALAVLLGAAHRLRDGRVRRAGRERISPADLPGGPALGEQATLLQFSTELCSPCRAAARVLGSAAAATPGVAHLDIDLTDDPDTARRFGILRTPTTLVLDRHGAVRGRIGGAPRPEELRGFLAESLGLVVPAQEALHVRS